VAYKAGSELRTTQDFRCTSRQGLKSETFLFDLFPGGLGSGLAHPLTFPYAHVGIPASSAVQAAKSFILPSWLLVSRRSWLLLTDSGGTDEQEVV